MNRFGRHPKACLLAAIIALCTRTSQALAKPFRLTRVGTAKQGRLATIAKLELPQEKSR